MKTSIKSKGRIAQLEKQAVFKANLVRSKLKIGGIQSHKQQSNFFSKMSLLQWQYRGVEAEIMAVVSLMRNTE